MCPTFNSSSLWGDGTWSISDKNYESPFLNARGFAIYSLPNSTTSLWYHYQTAQLKSKYGVDRFNQAGSDARFDLKTKLRNATVGPTRIVLDKVEPVTRKTAPASFWLANKPITILGAGGLALGAYGAYTSVSNIYEAENKTKQIIIEAARWEGAMLGAELMAPFTAAIAPCFGLAAPIAAIIIIGAGSAAGSMGGIAIAESVLNDVK